MKNSSKRTYSAYSTDAMHLLGATIRAERKTKRMSELELAERAGISRGVVQRIEKGDMSCGIGIVFEAAHIVGLTLFEAEPSRLASQITLVEEKLVLLPKAIHKKTAVINDDF